MAEDFSKLLEMATRTAERVEAIREDVAEIKASNRDRLNLHSKRLSDLEHSRSKVRGVLWTLTGIIGFVGGERLIEWLGRTGQ